MLKIIFSKETKIIDRIKANDRKVLGEVYQGCKRMIFNYILSHGGRITDAEDILQESVIVFWQRVASGAYEHNSKISTFILAVAKNKWMAEMRRKYKKDEPLMSDFKEEDQPDPDEQVIAKEKLDRVRKAMDFLNPLCKKLLLLFYFEERNMQEIASLLSLANENVAKAKKYQCKKALEKILNEQFIKSEGGM